MRPVFSSRGNGPVAAKPHPKPLLTAARLAELERILQRRVALKRLELELDVLARRLALLDEDGAR